MAERPHLARWREWLRWVVLGVAVVILVAFLLAQRQSISVSYGRSPSSDRIPEGSAGELSEATVPSVAEMTAMVDAHAVVRLPGSIANWDERKVRAAIGDSGFRILVAPPGLDEQEQDRVRDVKNATIQVVGTKVTGGIYQASGSALADWRSQFATGDVTNLLLTMVAGLRNEPLPRSVDGLRWRDPTGAELAAVTSDLRTAGLYAGHDASLTEAPDKAAATAFPAGDALYVVLPRQPYGKPIPRYGPALTTLFPGRPIVVMYGSWIEYHGPNAAEFADVAGASFYAQFADRLSRYDYPQRNILFAYLSRVTDVRYAGLFDRPLPYVAVDPLRVALPALPWLFAGCVVVFLALSLRSLLRRADDRPRRLSSSRRASASARLAGLTGLAFEMSALTTSRGDPALVRGITMLRAARTAIDEELPDRHVRALLDAAEAELDDTARSLDFAGYRPDVYLRSRLE